MIKFLHSILFIAVVFASMGQPFATPSAERLKEVKQREVLEKQSLINAIQFKNIGPRIMSGRVVDIAVNPNNTIEFYVAFASGGLWYTTNNGQSFAPRFDDQPVMTIGAIAVRWSKDGKHEVWVGTGEVNSSRSSYSGVGVFKSDDGGKKWTHLGLAESHHIGKVILHPTDKNIAYIAVLGHLYSANAERGVYKTTDAGKSWKKVLFIDENTGCVNLSIDPTNTQIVYANMWYRTRRAWNFEECGRTSGIYKTVDGGDTWSKISKVENGLPDGEGFGRSGIAVFPQNSNVLYCVIDNQNHRPSDESKNSSASEITSAKISGASREEFLQFEDKEINAYLQSKEFPKRYTASVIKDMVRKNKITPLDIVTYTDDANSLLFNTPIIGAEIYKSNDGGAHWTKQNMRYLDYVFNTYGYYFGQVVVSPSNENQLFTFGVPLLKSIDAGASWKSIDGENVHGDYHVLWVDVLNPSHLICGNDGGVNISYDEGAHWIKCNSIPVAQCYSVNTDNAENYNVYAGLQDNNVWTGPHQGDEGVAWHQEGDYSFKPLIGGDGMQVQVDTRDNNTIYTGYQFGNYFRIDKNSGEAKTLTIEENIGDEKLRWNWNTPIIISKSSQDVLYWGSNKLHRSLNKGETWKTISGDLTFGKKEGDIAYGTLTSIDESLLQFGLLYTGSDDGKIAVTKNGGSSWQEIGANLCRQLKVPENLWVSRVISSSFHLGRVYVTLNGYRNDDFNAYVFESDDFGTTWKSISANLPNEPVNVLREDNTNENVLYLGTDYGVYVSLNAGASWMRWNKGMPNVAVYDLVIQERERQLVVGTHGRSIYIGDVSLIQLLDESTLASSLQLFTEKKYKLPRGLGKKNNSFFEKTAPQLEINYYSKQNAPIQLKITDSNGNVLFEKLDTAIAGLNVLEYNYTIRNLILNKKNTTKLEMAEDGNFYIQKGAYKFSILSQGVKVEKEIELTDK